MGWNDIKLELGKWIKGAIRLREPMDRHTTWRIGGPADMLVVPLDAAELKTSLNFARERELPVTLLGNGSNVLVLDDGLQGMVLKTGRIKQLAFEGSKVFAEAGCPLPALARSAASRGLGGLEFVAGIPGTVGAAALINAGAWGRSIGEFIEEVTVIGPGGDESLLPKECISFGYRHSSLREQKAVITGVTLQLSHTPKIEVLETIRRLMAHRREHQPRGLPNAGSVFINPPHNTAGFLIEQAGAKGLRCGDAQVSEIHANFIVNLGSATARDVLALIETVRSRVLQQFGVRLETEINILGNSPPPVDA